MNLKYSVSNCIKMANHKEASLACVLSMFTNCTSLLLLLIMNTEWACGSEPRKILLGFCSKLLSLSFQYHKKVNNRNNTTTHLLDIICHKLSSYIKLAKSPIKMPLKIQK